MYNLLLYRQRHERQCARQHTSDSATEGQELEQQGRANEAGEGVMNNQPFAQLLEQDCCSEGQRVSRCGGVVVSW